LIDASLTPVARATCRVVNSRSMLILLSVLNDYNTPLYARGEKSSPVIQPTFFDVSITLVTAVCYGASEPLQIFMLGSI
jgi:hypothetical protein